MLAEAAKKEKVAIVNITQPDNDMIVNRYMNSPIAGIQIALGNLETAFNYLKIQLGITSNYDTLKNVIKDVYMSNYAHIKFIPCVPPKEYILRQTLGESIFPQNGVNFASLKRLLTVKNI